MYWIKGMQNAINYIEGGLLADLNIEDIAKSANSSSANFQRIFSIVTGMTVGDYIRGGLTMTRKVIPNVPIITYDGQQMGIWQRSYRKHKRNAL